MNIWRAMTTTTRVATTAGYHLSYGALADPETSALFVRTIANAVVDFQVPVRRLLPPRRLDELCPGIETIDLPLRITPYTIAELPPAEWLCVTALMRYLNPLQVLEIGTNKGRTTRLMAEHSPAQAVIHTLDLPPERVAERKYVDAITAGQIGEAFRGQSAAAKINQLRGDSQTFDFTPFLDRMDFIFIDGDHRYDSVKSDTANALRMLKPGGVILWDDYHPVFPGIIRCLQELARERDIYQIPYTRFAYYRHDERAHSS